MQREIWLLLDSRGLGGIETHVAELACGLAEAGAAPRVLFLHDHGPHPLRQRLGIDGIACGVAGGFGGLLRRLRRDRPALLHTHGYKSNLLGRAAARLAGIPCVATYHAGDRPGGMLAVYDALDRWTCGAGGRIAVSAPILRRLPFGGVLVPNFVAVPDAAPEPGPDTVGFVGRLSHEKGPDVFAAIAERLGPARFVAYGDGPMRAALQDASGTRVGFAGAVTAMDAAWQTIGLLVVSSRAEGLPLAALEAMARGIPVAAFALGGLPDLVHHDVNGFLAEPGDTDALAGAVSRWLRMGTTARRAMATQAWETVRAHYGRAAGVAATRAVYATAGMRLR